MLACTIGLFPTRIFNHVNIVEYAGRPANHNELIQQNWRKLVRPEDTVLHLGDVLMGRRELWPSMPGWLPGKVTVLNSGNHDEPHKRKFMEEEWGWTFVDEFLTLYKDYVVMFSHYPWGAIRDRDPNSTSNTDLTFEKMPEGKTLSVHGHIHEKPDPSLNYINVSVERMQYRPVNLQQLLDARINLLEKL